MAPMEDFDLLGLGNLDPSPPPLAAATPKKSDSKSKISKNKSADTLRSSGSESKQKSEYSAKLESRINRRNSHQNKRPAGEKHYQPVRRVSSSLLDINELDTAPSKTISSEKERRPHSGSFQASPLLDVVESINLEVDKKAAPLRGRRVSSNNLTEPIKEEETPKGSKETRETTTAANSSTNNNGNKKTSMLALDKEQPPKKRSTKDPPKSNGSDQDPPKNSRPRPRSTLRKSMAKFGDTIKLDAVSRRGRSTGKSVGSKSRTSDKDSNKGDRVSEVDQSEKSAFGHKRRSGRSSSRPKRAVTTVDFTSKIDASEKSSGRRKTAGDAVKTTGKKLSQSLGHRSSIKKKDEDGKKSDSKDKVGKKLSQSLGAHKSTDRTSSAKKKEEKKPEDKKDSSTPTQTKSKKLSASVGPNSEPIDTMGKSKRLSCSTGDADDAFLPLSRRSRTDSQDDLCLLERRSSTTKVRATRNNSFNGTDTKDKDRHSHDKDKGAKHDKDKGHGNKDKSLPERKLDRRFSDNFASVTAPQGRKKPTNALRRNSMDESSLNLFGAGTLMKKSPSMNIFEDTDKSDKEDEKKGLGIDNADDLLAFTTWGAKKDIVAAKKEKEEKKKKSNDELDDELGAFTTWGKGKKGLDVSTAESKSSTGKKEKRKTDHTETTKTTSKSSMIDASHKEKEHRKKSPPKHSPRPVETATPIATPVVVKGPRVSRITVCAVCFLYIISLGVVGLLGFWMHMMWFPDTTFSISNANEGDGEGNKTVNEGVILNTVGDGAPSSSPMPTGSSAPTEQPGSTTSDGPTYETTYSPTTTPTYITAKPTRRKNGGKNKPENNNTPKKPGGTKPGKKPNKPAKGQVIKEGSPTTEPKSDSATDIPTSEATTLTPTEAATTYTPTFQPTMTQSPSENPSYPPTISAMPSLSPTGIPSCPDPGELTKMADLGPNAPIKMFYEVVPLPQSDPHAGLLCAAIEYAGNAGWIGIAVSGASRDPAFGRKEAIIGITGVQTMSVVALPGDEVGIGMQAVNHDNSPWVNPGKYEIPAGGGVDGYTGPSLDTLLPPERQTLLNATISTFGPNEKLKEPVTIMTFTKYLLEPNEIDIIPFNKILFLYAVAAIDEDGEYNDNPEWIVNYVRLLDFESESRSSFGEVKRKRLRGHKGEFG